MSGPLLSRNIFIIKSETKEGTAITITKSVRQKALNLIPDDSIKRASKTPKKKVVAVAATAQTRVQPKTGKKVPAMLPVRISPNEANPVQENPIG